MNFSLPLPRALGALVVSIIGFAMVSTVPASAGQAFKVNPKTGAIKFKLRGGVTLKESSASGQSSRGRAGFMTGGRWYHATRVLDGPAGNHVVTGWNLATNDPAGRTISLAVYRNRPDSTRVRVEVRGGPVDMTGIGFRNGGRERMLGFGERSDHVDQRGNVVENFVGEGPYLEADYPLISGSVPAWGRHQRSDASYFPMPWMLSTRGFGVLIDNFETSRFDLDSAKSGTWSAEVDAQQLEFRVFSGPRPAGALRRMSAAVGRQPKPDAPWLFGPWFQTGHANTEPDELAFADALRAADAPVSAVETHMRYMPCGSDLGSEATEKARTAAFRARGLATLSYTREAVCASYEGPFNEAVAKGAFLKRADGSPFTFDAFVGSGVTQLGMFDFTDPDAQGIYSSILDRAYDAGYDGWMEDYGEYTPPDSVASNGQTGKQMHNRYPNFYHRAGMRYSNSKKRPVIRFVRSGWTGTAKHAQIVWGGDPSTSWEFDGLQSSVREALTMGLSGVSLWASDIGGFFSLTGPKLDEELLARWIQFGAFSGVMRSKAEGIGDSLENRPQIWDEPTLPIWRRYAKLRTQLYPYLVTADREYRRNGLPIMRHLALAYPKDHRATGLEDQFMFGSDLMVAPVLEPGATSRKVYLPKGRWIDFWKAVGYGEKEGSFDLRRARTIGGGRAVKVAAPLDTIPLMARAGTILP
ncbi:MAG: hypothetical protein M3Y23_06190, partial [Actinomycetota bacterium]|nr:hypothetical protein [Actinomycetota bacterium]